MAVTRALEWHEKGTRMAPPKQAFEDTYFQHRILKASGHQYLVMLAKIASGHFSYIFKYSRMLQLYKSVMNSLELTIIV